MAEKIENKKPESKKDKTKRRLIRCIYCGYMWMQVKQETVACKKCGRRQTFQEALDRYKVVFPDKKRLPDIKLYKPKSSKRKYVLILGNGLSRLEEKVKKFIHNWKHEIWVCNRAYQEALELPNITRVNGHKECLIEAYNFKIKHNLGYDCYGGNEDYGIPLKRMSGIMATDSGTGWVICAIKEGYDKIYCAGFDLKGGDIYYKKMNYHEPKPCWVQKWRIIEDKFGFDKITFIGSDIKKLYKEEM